MSQGPNDPKRGIRNEIQNGDAVFAVLKREWKEWIESGDQSSARPDCWYVWPARYVDELIPRQPNTS
ncbi:MAG TPA: hypothetical protein DD670_20130 [Planctomycetaceae bacterium]|nr:hypothetical protein [Planctomycetaceae bacterium]